MKSYAVLMTQDNPEHTNRFYTIEYVEYVMLVFENNKGLLQIKRCQHSHP